MLDVSGPNALSLLWLSDATRARLLVGDEELWVPWEVALLLMDLSEQPERAQTLLPKLPTWIAPEDIEVLTDLLMRAELPPVTPYCLHLKAKGRAGSAGYAPVVEWVTPPPKRLPLLGGVEWSGGLMWQAAHPESPARLTFGQWSVLAGLVHLGALGTDRTADLLATDRLLASIPPGDEGVLLDSFLAREQVVEASAVAPRLVPTADGRFAVRPHVDGIPDGELDAHFRAVPANHLGDGVLAIRHGDQRRRVVFSDRAREGLKDLKQFSAPLTATQAARALSQPSLFFGLNVDTSALSERVVGLGLDVRTPSPKLREIEGGGWLDGLNAPPSRFDISASEGVETDDLDLSNPPLLQHLLDAVAQAQAERARFIPHPTRTGVLIELTRPFLNALDAAKLAITPPDEDEEAADEIDARTVLQVLDNVHELRFTSPAPLPSTPAAPGPPARPPGLADGFDLFAYQNDGTTWLLQKSGAEGPNPQAPAPVGALLADDMGLGKTLQVLSFLSRCIEQGRERPHLVVAPVALITNWQREAARFFPGRFDPVVHVNGPDLPEDFVAAAAYLSSLRLVLVSYETLRRHELSFAQVSWQTVILDEAQKAKNPDTQIARVIRTLQAHFRLAVTGTPVENSLTELWTLIDWLAPGLLGSLRDFNRDFTLPLQNDYEAGREDLAAQLQQTIRPIFLRRTKQEVLVDKLPPISVSRHIVRLSDDQWQRYTQIAQHARATGRTLADLNKLFAVCAHPALHDDRLLLEPLATDPFPKGQKLFELLDEIRAAKEKALLFANRHRIQRWIADEVHRRYGFTPAIINGSLTGSERRMQIVDDFNDSPKPFDVLILAPRAAGMGLNITGGNHVIHYMREWNPAIENQATDRAYRIGQKRPVTVHHLITTAPDGVSPINTVEQILDELLASKRQLMSDFIIPMGRADVEHQEIWQAVER